jgi:hypothetical protein
LNISNKFWGYKNVNYENLEGFVLRNGDSFNKTLLENLPGFKKLAG